ncbi:MAG TPA: type II toxin-antitoxin system PemK/MazF family toxin [Terriglobales bacterium]|nr:type II toxin-antitoxin system PemK/MazF family toxin [Terriglobales bacterium]
MSAWARAATPLGWFPRRGEVCLVDIDKERPAIIFSSDALNKFSQDVCVIPISKVEHKQFSLRPKLNRGEAGLDYDSWVKCDQPTTVEKRCVVYPPLGTLLSARLDEIDSNVKVALGLK